MDELLAAGEARGALLAEGPDPFLDVFSHQNGAVELAIVGPFHSLMRSGYPIDLSDRGWSNGLSGEVFPNALQMT